MLIRQPERHAGPSTPTLSGMSPSTRADSLFQFTDLLEANSSRFVIADNRRMGGTVDRAIGGIWVACNTMSIWPGCGP